MNEPGFFDQLERACHPQKARVRQLQGGEALFRQGDLPPGLPLLVTGRIELLRWTAAGRAVRLHVARAGETFAEASIHAEHCHCDAVAAVPSTVRLLPTGAVRRAFAADPDLAGAFSLHVAQALMSARRLLELRAVTPLTARVLERLRELADASGDLPPDTRLTAIAAELGVTAPALYRALAALEDAGALARPGQGMVRLL